MKEISSNAEGPVYRSYVRPAILYGIKAWCLKMSKMGILRRTERCIVGAVCGVWLESRKRTMDVLLLLSLKQIMDQLSVEAVYIGMVMFSGGGGGWSCLEKGIRLLG